MKKKQKVSEPTKEGVVLSKLLENIFSIVCLIAQGLLCLFTLNGLTKCFTITITSFTFFDFLFIRVGISIPGNLFTHMKTMTPYAGGATIFVAFLTLILFIIALINFLRTCSLFKKINGSGTTLDFAYKRAYKSFTFAIFIILLSYMAAGQELLINGILCFVIAFILFTLHAIIPTVIKKMNDKNARLNVPEFTLHCTQKITALILAGIAIYLIIQDSVLQCAAYLTAPGINFYTLLFCLTNSNFLHNFTTTIATIFLFLLLKGIFKKEAKPDGFVNYSGKTIKYIVIVTIIGLINCTVQPSSYGIFFTTDPIYLLSRFAEEYLQIILILIALKLNLSALRFDFLVLPDPQSAPVPNEMKNTQPMPLIAQPITMPPAPIIEGIYGCPYCGGKLKINVIAQVYRCPTCKNFIPQNKLQQ